MMNTSAVRTPAGTPAQRLSLNQAAAKIAQAYGFEILGRETYEPNSGKLLIKWSLRHKELDERWDMELFCLAPLWWQGGWGGDLRISTYGKLPIVDKTFVPFDKGIYGRKACKLTRERFCAWAESLLAAPASVSALQGA
jgi:hypothetical protein